MPHHKAHGQHTLYIIRAHACKSKVTHKPKHPFPLLPHLSCSPSLMSIIYTYSYQLSVPARINYNLYEQ